MISIGKVISWRIGLGSFFLFVILSVFYLPDLPGPKILDDRSLTEVPQLLAQPNFQSIKSIFTPGNHLDYYPVRDLSYLVDIHLLGNSPLAFRIHQMLLMFALIFLLYVILLKLDLSPARGIFDYFSLGYRSRS